MLRWFLLVLFSFVLFGCASKWEHSSKTSSEFYADDRECQVMAGGADRGLTPGDHRTSYESCMWQKGWRKKRSIWFFDPAVQ